MKKTIILLLTLFSLSFAFGQLSAGDIAFVQYNADGSNDNFAFVALVNIPSNEVIKFTDNEENDLSGGEGTITWTAPSSGVSCGTVITITSTPSATLGTVTEVNDIILSTSGDGIIAYQGSAATPTFITALGNDGSTAGTYSGTKEGNLPTGLTLGVNAQSISETDNAKYDSSLLSDTGANLSVAIYDATNWIRNNTTNQTFNSSFTVTDCTITPTITLTPTTLNTFEYGQGNGPSVEQTYTVEGSNLTGNIIISPPANWEISTTSGGPYQTTDITLTQSGGTVNATNIYIRMVASLLAVNSPFSGVVTHKSTGATQVDLNVDGTVTSFLECTINNEIIGQQDFETSPATPEMATTLVTSKIFDTSSLTAGSLYPQNEDYFVSGTNAKYIKGNYAGTIEFATIDVSDATNIEFSLRLAAFASTSTQGLDGTDYITVLVSTDGGTNYSEEIKITGKDSTPYNSRWSFTTGTGTASTVYDGDNTNSVFEGGGGNATTDGYSTVKITGLPNSNQLRIKIWFSVNDNREYWMVDDAKITGDKIVSTTWSGTAWSNNAPTSTTKAVFDGDYTTTSTTNIEACACQLTSNATVTVAADTYLDIQNEIVNDGLLIIDKTGAIVQHNNDATVTGGGLYQTTVQTTSMDDARYTYFSSPTQTDTMNVFNSWAATNRMFGWDGTNQVWSAVTTATTMTPGLGYIVRPTTGATFPGAFSTDFTGAFNNGIITTTLYNTNVYSNDDDDSSLVGNPYPSAINTADLLAANTGANVFHFWSHSVGGNWSGEGYKTFNNTGTTNGAPANIATGQGFFVTSTAAGTFTFSNDQRVTGSNNTFLRPANNLDKVWLNVITNTNAGSQILLGFIPTKTDGFDAQYDAAQINSGTDNISFGSKGTDAYTTNLVIQARNVLSDDDTIIPLNVFVNDSNIQTATISIDHLENLTDRNIFLKDNVLNTLTDLKQGDYQFTVSQTGVINDRFEVLFSRNTLAVNENSTTTQLVVAQKGDYFTLSTSDNHTIDNASLYNMLGQNLGFFKASSNNLQIPATNITSGTVLIIKTTLDNGSTISKKVIKL